MSNEIKDKKRSSFTGKLGYVLTVAGASVGLGNIWRFPYLAARYGGAMFLLAYFVLMLTFGNALIISETTIGRMTKKSPVGAFSKYGKGIGFKFGGWINAIIPLLILPYYSVIGGWVVKYMYEYIRFNGRALADDGYFAGFIGSAPKVGFWFIIFSLSVLVVILLGVTKGIEKLSKFIMPLLVVLAIIISIYSMTREGAIGGVKYFLVPDFKNFSFMTIVAAMGQMFYSLSIAMGILYTYGSYMKKETDIEKATTQIEIFDTAIAILAGLMIIPAVFAFSGGDKSALQAGPSLMFITIPKVFASIEFGLIGGALFFILVFFAAQTSAIALAESVVSTFCDQFGFSRIKAVIVVGITMILLGSLSVLGFNELSHINIIGMDILSFFDFLTNSIMMPIAAIATCILVYRVIGVDEVIAELEKNNKFKRKAIYKFTMKVIAPVCLAIILLSSIANAFGIISL